MPRAARFVVPDAAHHITQRGNRQQPLFSVTPTGWNIFPYYPRHYSNLVRAVCHGV